MGSLKNCSTLGGLQERVRAVMMAEFDAEQRPSTSPLHWKMVGVQSRACKQTVLRPSKVFFSNIAGGFFAANLW